MTVDRIDLLVALAIKNNISPYKNSFPAFARAVLITKCQVSTTVANNELKTALSAWAADKWASHIKNNPCGITREEIDKWEHDYKLVSCII
jgi:hypothetical protein